MNKLTKKIRRIHLKMQATLPDPMKNLERIRKAQSEEEARAVVDEVEHSWRDKYPVFIERALLENVFSQAELDHLHDVLGLLESEVVVLLQGIFGFMDLPADKKDDCILLTTEESSLYANRDYLMKRFATYQVGIKTAAEANEYLRQEVLYDEEKRREFIIWAKGLGYSNEEIKEVLDGKVGMFPTGYRP